MSARLSYASNDSNSRRTRVLDLISAVASLWPDQPTKPPRRRPRVRGAPGHVPAWLRHDIGLPPVQESKSFWDHQ